MARNNTLVIIQLIASTSTTAKKSIFLHPTLVDTLVDLTLFKPELESRVRALKVLSTIASIEDPEVKRSLYARPNLISGLVFELGKDNPYPATNILSVRKKHEMFLSGLEYAIKAITEIADEGAYLARKMHDFPGLFDGLTRIKDKSSSAYHYLKELATKAITKISSTQYSHDQESTQVYKELRKAQKKLSTSRKSLSEAKKAHEKELNERQEELDEAISKLGDARKMLREELKVNKKLRADNPEPYIDIPIDVDDMEGDTVSALNMEGTSSTPIHADSLLECADNMAAQEHKRTKRKKKRSNLAILAENVEKEKGRQSGHNAKRAKFLNTLGIAALDKFIAVSKFKGEKPSMVFKLGDDGLGYYKDV